MLGRTDAETARNDRHRRTLPQRRPPSERQRIPTDTGARVFLPFLCEERAALAALLRDEAGHEHHLHEAHRLYTEMSATGHAQRVGRELAEA